MVPVPAVFRDDPGPGCFVGCKLVAQVKQVPEFGKLLLLDQELVFLFPQAFQFLLQFFIFSADYTEADAAAFEEGIASREDAAKVLKTYCDAKGLTFDGLFIGNENGDLMESKVFTRAEYAQVLLRLVDKKPMALTSPSVYLRRIEG